MIDLEILHEILSGIKAEHKNSLEASSVINEVWKEVLEYSEPEWKKGKWIHDNPNTFKCSKCNKYLDIGCGNMKMNFCPHCGSYNGGEHE